MYIMNTTHTSKQSGQHDPPLNTLNPSHWLTHVLSIHSNIYYFNNYNIF